MCFRRANLPASHGKGGNEAIPVCSVERVVLFGEVKS